MNAGIHHEVLANNGTVGSNIPHVFNHGYQRDRRNSQDSIRFKLRDAKQLGYDILVHKGKEMRLPDSGEITEAKGQADQIARNDGEQDRHQVKDTLCKNGNTDYHGENHYRNQYSLQAEFSVIIKCTVNCRAAQTQPDDNDDRTRYDRGQQFIYLFISENLNQAGKKYINKTGNNQRAFHGRQLVQEIGISHSGVPDNCHDTCHKGEAGAQENGHLFLCDPVEQQCAQAGTEQCDRGIQPCQCRNQYGGAEHGQGMLNAQNQLLPRGLFTHNYISSS